MKFLNSRLARIAANVDDVNSGAIELERLLEIVARIDVDRVAIRQTNALKVQRERKSSNGIW